MKKITVSLIYLSGWIYPLSVTVYSLLDYYFRINNSHMGPFDFGNDSILGYMFHSLIFALITFVIYFASVYEKGSVSNMFYLTLINLPLYILGVQNGFWSETYVLIPIASLIVFIATIIFTLSFNMKKTYDY